MDKEALKRTSDLLGVRQEGRKINLYVKVNVMASVYKVSQSALLIK